MRQPWLQNWQTVLTLAVWSSQWVSGIPSRMGECFQSSFRTAGKMSEGHIMMVNDCSVTTGKWALLVWDVLHQGKGSISYSGF